MANSTPYFRSLYPVEKPKQPATSRQLSTEEKACAGCRLEVGSCMCETPKPRMVFLNCVKCPDCWIIVPVVDWHKHRTYMEESN
jgi:hypothetical protein